MTEELVIGDRCARFKTLYADTIKGFIAKPHVVIGCGAIGGYIIRTLGQIGVQKITLWDDDIVEEVNIGPQGFPFEHIDNEKVSCRRDEFWALAPYSECEVFSSRFRKRAEHPEDAFWWMCVDSLDARELIHKTAHDNSPHRIIDMRMGGMTYEVYHITTGRDSDYKESIQFARDNPVEEGCTTRSTPHCAMIAASIGVDFGLKPNPPFSVKGNMMDYAQEVRW